MHWIFFSANAVGIISGFLAGNFVRNLINLLKGWGNLENSI